jgi:phage tail-like protein
MTVKVIDAPPGCRFYVQVDGAPQAVFTEMSGLSLEMTVEDIEEGGQNDHVHRLPGRCKVGNITLKRGLTTSNEFFKWSLEVAQGQIKRRHVTVYLYNPDGTEAMKWNFASAFPVKWTGPQFKADDTAIAIETVELAHTGFTVG